MRTQRFIPFTMVVTILFNSVPLSSHDIYRGWKTEKGVSCCNGSDFRPVRALQDYDGSWFAWVDGGFVRIPPSQLLKIPSRDGRSHWCGTKINDLWVTYCFVKDAIRRTGASANASRLRLNGSHC